jgi:hypothetical protein
VISLGLLAQRLVSRHARDICLICHRSGRQVKLGGSWGMSPRGANVDESLTPHVMQGLLRATDAVSHTRRTTMSGHVRPYIFSMAPWHSSRTTRATAVETAFGKLTYSLGSNAKGIE